MFLEAVTTKRPTWVFRGLLTESISRNSAVPAKRKGPDGQLEVAGIHNTELRCFPSYRNRIIVADC